MRFKAPPHTHDAHLSTGIAVVDKNGFITVADDISEGDRLGLKAAGFIPEEPAADAAAAPAPAPAAPKALKSDTKDA